MSRKSHLPGRLLRCEKGMAALEFILIAPALFALIFIIVLYSFYFAAVMGVRQAAAEGARAAVAGISISQREELAKNRADAVINAYGPLLAAGEGAKVEATTGDSVETFKVKVTYNISESALYDYSFLPMPPSPISATTTVTNGSY